MDVEAWLNLTIVSEEGWDGEGGTSKDSPVAYYAEASSSSALTGNNHSVNGSSPHVTIGPDSSESDTASNLYYYELLLAHPDIRMRDELIRYMTPVLVVVGNLSNLTAFVLLRRRNLRKSSACFYMAAYALANVFVLNLILGVLWLCFILEVPYIGAITDWGCRLWTFVSNVIIYCGVWFVVALSADRFVYLCYSHKAKTWCTVFASKIGTIAILVMLVVVSIHAMWTFELHAQGCFVASDDNDLHSKIWPLWSATVYSYLPLTLLMILNILLSISLCLKRHTQRRNTSTIPGDDFTITTLVISFGFLLLTVPATVINIVDIYFPSQALSIDLIAQLELGKTITEILSSANQTLLGFILLLFSQAVRQELYALVQTVQLKRRPKVYEMGNLGNNAPAAGAGGGGGGGERGALPPTAAANNAQSAAAASNAAASNGRAASAVIAEPGSSSRNHIEYEVCNSSDITSV